MDAMTPRGAARGARLLAVFLVLAWLAGPAVAAAAPFELEGTWFVVAHFKDDSTNNPDAMRWLDEVWVFEKKGSRMSWTKYPLVVFQDTTGRFERRGGNPRSRVLAAWEPNENQMAELMEGPRVNERGAKTKTLRGDAKRGFASASRMQVRSASVVGYQEDWSVTGLDGNPVFKRVDMMGRAGSAKAEGQTVFEVTELGDPIRGTYERDGIRHGTFLMMRTPPVRGLVQKEGTPNERAMKRAREQYIERERQKYDDGQELSPEAQEYLRKQKERKERMQNQD